MANFNPHQFGAKVVNDFDPFKYGAKPIAGAAQELAEVAQAQNAPIAPQPRQMQEEFSNPAYQPGFENLSQQEKLERIAASQFNPANETGLGTFVPGGAYEHPVTRMAASVLPTFAAPQFAGGGILKGLSNALSRIGSGVASNIAYQSPNINNLETLRDVAQESAKANALLEAPITALKGVRGAAEIYNPSHRYAAQKVTEIKNEASAAKALQKETYRPVFEKYGKEHVTTNPEKYLSDLGIDKKHLYSESKKMYEAFLNEPNFQNLHNLQSKIGGDIRKVALAKNKPLTEDRFTQYRKSLQDSLSQFIKNDTTALNQYNLGSQITRELVEPFNAGIILKQISKGTRINPTPKEIASSIKKGREKIVGEVKGKPITAIPEGHPLERHFNAINNRLSTAEGLQGIMPEFVKKLLPKTPAIIQGQRLNKAFETANPFYYGYGREEINK